MPNLNYNNGAAKERRIVNKARQQGCLAFRSAGSHSPVDVFILDPVSKTIELVQCKPRSMQKKDLSPTAEAQRLIDELKKFDGTYEVKTTVEFTGKSWITKN